MRFAILSDIHGNLEAFARVLEDIERQRVAATFCLGDIIGYGPDPEAVVELLRRRAIPSVMGNHELGLAKKSQLGWFNPMARKALSVTQSLLSSQARDYVVSLPRSLAWADYYFVHGFPPDSVRIYLFEKDRDELMAVFVSSSFRVCFVGHTHELEVVWRKRDQLRRTPLMADTLDKPVRIWPDAQYIINVGSVGQPRDGDNRAKYMIFDEEAQNLELRCLEYDFETTARKILDRGLPEQYARRLC